MNEKDFVSFEIAVKLKDKGFSIPFYFYYRTDDAVKNIHHAIDQFRRRAADIADVRCFTLQRGRRYITEVIGRKIRIHPLRNNIQTVFPQRTLSVVQHAF